MTPLTKASLATSTSGCPANISPDVDPALCDPASFERAPDEFVTEIDAGFGKMKVRVCFGSGSLPRSTLVLVS
jgi:hypothetical protein